MPTVNQSSRTPRRDGPSQGSATDWAVPLIRGQQFQLSLSYAIFFAIAGLLAAVAAAAGREGNSDLVRSAFIGSGVWVAGWAIQLAAALFFSVLFGLRIGSITVGLVGVEFRPHTWPPGRALALVVCVLAAVLLVGAGFWVTDAGQPSLNWSLWRPPSLGLTSADSVLHASAWLLLLQSLCQLFPLPSTLGRLGLLSLVGLAAPHASARTQLLIARRCLKGLALVTAVGALALMPLDSQLNVPRWPLLLVLAAVLWMSVRAGDLRDMIDRFSLATDADVFTDQQPTLAARLRDCLRTLQNQRKLVEAAKRERSEAVDAGQLDEILDRLHQEGPDALSDHDRAVLRRVSETLRQFRDSGSREAN